ncbi:BZ3500_MvSof-1268-A1-R1_Chr4-3g07410 [Microbotryum saponariae]|uniref:BZ3500_MvSof-1268-A1-R1_Chr4-3g07410 protein n=1 Tax=Microbotryum saponariae TaxID=289078 RepID=A0A2X0KZ00_9BASI|nr:BZ3500_MvSof-1268-A1-R1_Chr4-3g07410 [Microbotryum saponariae]SDA07073.1 BZ3501_MvSof-1269-A2-R1_Chr4-2g07119 [Microbotryum saponariae]
MSEPSSSSTRQSGGVQLVSFLSHLVHPCTLTQLNTVYGRPARVAVSSANRRITKEYAELQADWPPYVVAQPDESNLLHWTGTITGPPDSAYKGGKFKIDITFPIEYPFKSPNVSLKLITRLFSEQATRIYHPNVTDDGALCVGVLKAEAWKPSTKIDQVLRALVQLLQEPNADDALVATIAEVSRSLLLGERQAHTTALATSFCSQQYTKDRPAFNKTAQEWVKKYA